MSSLHDESAKSDRRSVLGKISSATALTILGTASQVRADPDLVHLRANLRRRNSKLSPLKTRAMHDYRSSLSCYGGRLSNPAEQLTQASCRGELIDVLIVGSGYGGSIAAARLSAARRPDARVAVLERGREWLPGTFPDTLPRLLRESRYGTFGPARQRLRNQLGLVDMTFHDEVFVLAASGLGGGSLINAGVAVAPDPDVFRQPCWPSVLQDREILAPYYELVARELNLQTIDCDTQKTRAIKYVAERAAHMHASVEPALVTVTYRGRGLNADGTNAQGMIQRPCTLCGDCSSGCNVGAKNTLAMNYLPLAKMLGAELYAQTEVEYIEKTGDTYRVHFVQHGETPDGLQARRGQVSAKVVVLAAGSLGTTGILLRSRSPSFRLSDQLGCGFSGNGDTYGFMVRGDCKTNTAGVGAYESDAPAVGVSQQMHLYLHDQDLARRMLLQEGSVPRAYTNALGALLVDLDLDRALPFFALGHDGANGRIRLRSGRPSVVWPERPKSGYTQFAHEQLKRLAHAGNGKYRKAEMLGDKSVTVHPLGGCSMADSIHFGVASDLGCVFDGGGSGGRAQVHSGLYVADGSLIPTSLAANPFLTISALSERIAEGILRDQRFADLFPHRSETTNPRLAS